MSERRDRYKERLKVREAQRIARQYEVERKRYIARMKTEIHRYEPEYADFTDCCTHCLQDDLALVHECQQKRLV